MIAECQDRRVVVAVMPALVAGPAPLAAMLVSPTAPLTVIGLTVMGLAIRGVAVRGLMLTALMLAVLMNRSRLD